MPSKIYVFRKKCALYFLIIKSPPLFRLCGKNDAYEKKSIEKKFETHASMFYNSCSVMIQVPVKFRKLVLSNPVKRGYFRIKAKMSPYAFGANSKESEIVF